MDAQGAARAEDLPLAPGLKVTVLVPTAPVATRVARKVLPDAVPHGDAAFNLGRASLLVLALAGRHDLFLPATQDRLHQPYRQEVLRESSEMVARLRALGHPAVISGAGPTVLTFDAIEPGLCEHLRQQGWDVRELPIDVDGARFENVGHNTLFGV